jgi:hypothetical protein
MNLFKSVIMRDIIKLKRVCWIMSHYSFIVINTAHF